VPSPTHAYLTAITLGSESLKLPWIWPFSMMSSR
jgi:hypothetical protein